MGNIIEERRKKAWSHATYVILNRVRREAVIGTLFIYGGKDYFLTPDDAVDTIFVTMGVLKKMWERDGVKPTKKLFAEVCPDATIGALAANMWRDPFRYWR